MSVDNITVSLSRLALAKAIKTPDAEEDVGEPWINSVIFHQSHISPDMLEAMVNPRSQQRRHRQRGRPDQQRHSQMPSSRQPKPRGTHSLEPRSHPTLPKDHPHRLSMPLQQQQKQYQRNFSRSSELLGQMKEPDQPNRPRTASGNRMTKKAQFASDDEDSHEEEESEEESSEDEHFLPPSRPTLATRSMSPSTASSRPSSSAPSPPRPSSDARSSPLAQPLSSDKNKHKKTVPLASEDESDQDDEQSSSDESDAEPPVVMEALKDEADARTQARRMSTLRQLERGTSVHKRSRSLGAMDKIYTADVALENGLVMTDAATSPVADQGGEDMSQWHRTIMDALQDPDEAAAVTTASGNDQLNNDVHVEPSPSSSASRPGSRARRNTLGQTDMLYYTQQQQLQVLQQQQMAQIQQYQQVAWQQQQQWMAAQAVQQQAALMQAYQVQQQQQQQQYRHQAPQPSSSRSANRLSAMDLLNQFEQEKAAKLPARRNKHKIDPSKAHIEGLLGNVKDQGQYTISFQQQQQAVKDRADRKYARPYTSNANYSSMPQRSTTPNNNNRRSMASSMMLGPGRTMVRSESSPNQLNPTLQHHPQQHSQSMYLDPTMAASSSASNLNLHRLTASKSTGRPVSSMMMRPHSSVDL